jgi:hypothetical protein
MREDRSWLLALKKGTEEKNSIKSHWKLRINKGFWNKIRHLLDPMIKEKRRSNDHVKKKCSLNN